MEIKLPRLKLDYSEDESFSLGKLSLPLIVGFGIHWAWVYLTMFNGKTLFFWEAVHAEQSSRIFFIISLACFIVALFSYAAFSRALRRLFATQKRRAGIRLGGATLACAGTLLICFADISTPAGTAIIGAGGITTGIGSAILLMSYGVSFGQCDIATIVTSTGLSLVVGIIVYAIIFNLGTLPPFGALTAAALPFIECYCLYKCSSVLIDKLQFAEITLKVRKGPFALHICASSILFGIALGSIRTEAIASMQRIDGIGPQVLCIGIAALTTCSLIIAVMLTQRQHLNFMFRTLLPIITIALVWLSLDSRGVTSLTTITLLCCYLLFESIMWVSYGDISQRFRLSAFIVFGFGRGSLALGALIGFFLAEANGPIGFASEPTTFTILTLGCMLIAFGILPRENEIRSLVIGESDNPVGEMKAVSSVATTATEETIRAGRFKRKCETIANRYLLSKKETEVLFLLAKGRNAAYIQEQLYISEGTARTHMRHIYRKLDVHTQQELIDMIDDVYVEDIL